MQQQSVVVSYYKWVYTAVYLGFLLEVGTRDWHELLNYRQADGPDLLAIQYNLV